MRGVKGTISLTWRVVSGARHIPAGRGAAATAGLCPTRPEEAGGVQPAFSAPEHAAKSLTKPAQKYCTILNYAHSISQCQVPTI